MKRFDSLIKDLLALDIMPETRSELVSDLKAYKEGKLSNVEIKYIEDLHARLVGGTGCDRPINTQQARSTSGHNPVELSLRAEISELRRKGRLVVAERDQLEREILALKAEIAQYRISSQPLDDQKFKKVKAAFARLYHPDNQTNAGFERTIRTEIFKEFWTEIERIERSV